MSLSFLHCQWPYFILPSAKLKPVSVKRELTFWEMYQWVEQPGISPPGTLTDGVRASGENIPPHRQGSQQYVIWNLLSFGLSLPLAWLVSKKWWGQDVQEAYPTRHWSLPACKQILSFTINSVLLVQAVDGLLQKGTKNRRKCTVCVRYSDTG